MSNSCGTRKDHGTNTIAEVTMAGVDSTSNNEQTAMGTLFHPIRREPSSIGTPVVLERTLVLTLKLKSPWLEPTVPVTMRIPKDLSNTDAYLILRVPLVHAPPAELHASVSMVGLRRTTASMAEWSVSVPMAEPSSMVPCAYLPYQWRVKILYRSHASSACISGASQALWYWRKSSWPQ